LFDSLVGRSGDEFLSEVFGRKWTLTRGGIPKVCFSVEDCLELLNALMPDVHARKRSKYKEVHDLLIETSRDVVRGDAELFEDVAMNFVSASMIRTLGSSTDKITNHSQIAEFLHGRKLACSDTLATHGEGWTFYLNLVHRANAQMRSLHHSLWALFGLSGGFNAYLTPPQAQGLRLHCDPHDVFVLQQAGNKTWSLFQEGTHEKICDVVLTPGDVLYLPAGVPHLAQSSGEASSLHLAVSVYRGFFTAAGVLAAWLELSGCRLAERLTEADIDRIEARRHRLSDLGGPWDRVNQLPAAPFSIAVLRAFDSTDLPTGADRAVAADLVATARSLIGQLYESGDVDDEDVAEKMQVLLSLPGHEQVSALMRAIFSTREYRWVSHYAIHQPKELRTDTAEVDLLPPGLCLKRRPDTSALFSGNGKLYLNGYRISNLPQGALPALRFCMGMHSGAAGRSFFFSDIPGPEEVAQAVVQILLEFEGLEQVPERPPAL